MAMVYYLYCYNICGTSWMETERGGRESDQIGREPRGSQHRRQQAAASSPTLAHCSSHSRRDPKPEPAGCRRCCLAPRARTVALPPARLPPAAVPRKGAATRQARSALGFGSRLGSRYALACRSHARMQRNHTVGRLLLQRTRVMRRQFRVAMRPSEAAAPAPQPAAPARLQTHVAAYGPRPRWVGEGRRRGPVAAEWREQRHRELGKRRGRRHGQRGTGPRAAVGHEGAGPRRRRPPRVGEGAGAALCYWR